MFGQFVHVSEAGTAQNLVDPDELAGTVAKIDVVFPTADDGSCTAVLITRTHLLTAGHCVTAALPGFPLQTETPTSIKATFAQDPNQVAFNGSLIELQGARGPSDLALIELTPAVPVTVVGQVPRVFIGNWWRAFLDGRLTGSSPVRLAQAVGYGRTTRHEPCGANPGEIPCGDGRRRRGSIQDLQLHYEECGVFSPDWCVTGSLLVDETPWAWDTRVGRGDSGGPLFMWDHVRNEFVVVGILARMSPENETQSWAATFNADFRSNGDFVRQVFSDPDDDEIDEAIDNCPAPICSALGWRDDECSNPDQLDTDGDGLGDVCDLCPQAVCDEIANLNPGIFGRFACVTTTQADADGDRIGDSCDLCPDTPGRLEEGKQADEDRDLVGDACDGCRERLSPFDRCTGDEDCGVLAGRCLMVPEQVNGGHCATEEDSDFDAVPDACDSCPDLWRANQTNSNAELEVALSVATAGHPDLELGDACDPVPLLRLADPVREPVWPGIYVQGDGMFGPEEELPLTGSSWLGDDGVLGAPVSRTYEVAFRHCDCVSDTGFRIDLETCGGPAGRCDPTRLADATKFRRITVRDGTGNTLGEDGGDAQGFDEGSAGPSHGYVWAHFDDIFNGKVVHRTGVRNGHSEETTYGVIASFVARTALNASSRDNAFELRTMLRLVETPFMRVLQDPLDGLAEPAGRCFTPNCGRHLRPWEGIVDPADLRSVIGQPAMLLAREETPTELGLQLGDAWENVASFASPELAELLAEPTKYWAWVTPVETQASLAARKHEGVAALVPLEGTPDGRPVRVELFEGTMRLEGEPAARSPVDPNLPPEAAVQVPEDGRVVYSASRGLLFVAGGAGPVGGYGRETIRRYSFATARWEPVVGTFDHRPERAVIGLAFDAPRNVLYVLDVADRWSVSGAPEAQARLVAYDLGAGKSRELWSTLHTSASEFTSLTADEEGMLVLVAAQSSVYTAWRIDPRGEKADFLGRVGRTGTVLDEPLLGWHELVVPIRDASGIRYDELPSSAFDEGPEPAGL